MTKENLDGKPAPRFPEHWIWQTEFSWHATAQQHLHSRLSSHCLVQSASVCHNHVVLSQLRTCLLSLVLIEQQHSGPVITDVSLDVSFEARILRILSYLQFWATLLNCIYVKKKKRRRLQHLDIVLFLPSQTAVADEGVSLEPHVFPDIFCYICPCMVHLTLLLLFFEVPPAEQMCMWEGWEGTQWTCCEYANIYGAEKCPIINNY